MLNAKVSLNFTEDELRFLVWAMEFLEGGPFGAEKEERREETRFKVRKALSDYEKGIIGSFHGGSFYIECAFCEGSGVFPDILPFNEIETEPCPVCEGRGLNAFRTTTQDAVKCRFCGGDGKAWDSSGYPTGDACQVCHGTGTILLESVSEVTEDSALWELIHPDISRVSRNRFESGHHADSVEAALKEVNRVVKEIVRSDAGEELDGAALMYKAFSPKQPIIRVGDLSTESGRNVQQGYMQIFAGAMTGIRNPKAHENIEVDRSVACHQLLVASMLMFKLDERA